MNRSKFFTKYSSLYRENFEDYDADAMLKEAEAVWEEVFQNASDDERAYLFNKLAHHIEMEKNALLIKAIRNLTPGQKMYNSPVLNFLNRNKLNPIKKVKSNLSAGNVFGTIGKDKSYAIGKN